MYWKATIVLGVVVLWTFLSLLPQPGFNPMPLPEFIPVTKPTQPQEVVTSSFHDSGYENAWIQFVEEKDGLIQVETVESKIVILFRPQREAMKKFNIGWIAPVTIKCADSSADCDLDPKHTLYIGNGQVELVQWKFLRKTKRLKMK